MEALAKEETKSRVGISITNKVKCMDTVPQCKSCQSIYSLVVLNSFLICPDCCAAIVESHARIQELKEELQELQESYYSLQEELN